MGFNGFGAMLDRNGQRDSFVGSIPLSVLRRSARNYNVTFWPAQPQPQQPQRQRHRNHNNNNNNNNNTSSSSSSSKPKVWWTLCAFPSFTAMMFCDTGIPEVCFRDLVLGSYSDFYHQKRADFMEVDWIFGGFIECCGVYWGMFISFNGFLRFLRIFMRCLKEICRFEGVWASRLQNSVGHIWMEKLRRRLCLGHWPGCASASPNRQFSLALIIFDPTKK